MTDKNTKKKLADKLKCNSIGQPRQKKLIKTWRVKEKGTRSKTHYGSFAVQLDRSMDASTLDLVYGICWILFSNENTQVSTLFLQQQRCTKETYPYQ